MEASLQLVPRQPFVLREQTAQQTRPRGFCTYMESFLRDLLRPPRRSLRPSVPARGGEPRPVSLVRWRRSVYRPAARAAFTSMRGVVGDSCGSRPTLRRPSPTADPAPGVWGEPRSSSLMVWRRRRRLALPSGRNSDPAALAGGRAYIFIDSNGYPCCCAPPGAWLLSSS